MKIRNIYHAIDLTIERHQAVIDGVYEDYEEAKKLMMLKKWENSCPLCEYKKKCKQCPWKMLTGATCLYKDRVLFGLDNKADIKRLKGWKKELKKRGVK